jgi:hypothetical protein
MLYDPHAKRQHALSSTQLPPLDPLPKQALVPELSIRTTIACVLALLALLGLAHRLDAQAEAEDAVLEQRINDRIERERTDRAWAHRMAVAYARGREDALQVAASSPEAMSLRLACNHLGAGEGLRR